MDMEAVAKKEDANQLRVLKPTEKEECKVCSARVGGAGTKNISEVWKRQD